MNQQSRKLVLITGSARRLGKGLAIRFAKCGWNIVVHHRNSHAEAEQTSQQLQGYGVETFIVQADNTNPKEIYRAVSDVVQNVGIPDVLVNNVGVFPPAKSIVEWTADEWDKVFQTNLRGHMLWSQEYVKHSQHGGKIINIASLGGIQLWQKRIPYNVSKSAVIQLSRALALECAPDITVNCVSPGALVQPEELSDTDKDLISPNKIPMQRHGNIDDIFEAVYFFANSTSYITGQHICVDGGLSLR